MKRIKSVNGYTIYEATSQRDTDNYGCEIGNFNIYLSTDIRDFGLTNSYPEYDNVDSLTYAIVICNGSRYAVACALADELSDLTYQDMDLVLEIERRLEAGDAVNTVRQCYDRENGILYESISDAIDHGFDPYANDEFDPYEDHPAMAYDEAGKLHVVEDEDEEVDEDLLDGDLEDVFEEAMSAGDRADHNLDYDHEETELLCRAMCAAGYTYDGLESRTGWLVFHSDYCDTQHFITWQAVREWLEGVVFDDPEVSDAVERVLHPERFDGTRLYDRVHARMTDYDYACPENFSRKLHAIADELGLSAEDIDGFMDDYMLWWEAQCCEEEPTPTTREQMKALHDGDHFFINGQDHIAQGDAHMSGDASYWGCIVYDTTGESFFEEEFPCGQPEGDYVVVYDGGHFIDSVNGFDSLTEAEDCARDILRNWMEECVSVRDWNQMVTECSVWVEANDGSPSGEAIWEPSDEELAEMGWVEHEEPTSHASYYVTLDHDDNTYTTHTVGFSDTMEPRQRKYAFFKTVAETIAFDDCSYDSVEEVVWDGEPCHYVGWQPGMLMEFRSNITGAIVFSARFPQWNH